MSGDDLFLESHPLKAHIKKLAEDEAQGLFKRPESLKRLIGVLCLHAAPREMALLGAGFNPHFRLSAKVLVCTEIGFACDLCRVLDEQAPYPWTRPNGVTNHKFISVLKVL